MQAFRLMACACRVVALGGPGVQEEIGARPTPRRQERDRCKGDGEFLEALLRLGLRRPCRRLARFALGHVDPRPSLSKPLGETTRKPVRARSPKRIAFERVASFCERLDRFCGRPDPFLAPIQPGCVSSSIITGSAEFEGETNSPRRFVILALAREWGPMPSSSERHSG